MREGILTRWIFFAGFLLLSVSTVRGSNFLIDTTTPFQITPAYFAQPPSAGDTIFISAQRTTSVVLDSFSGDSTAPIVIINKGGQVAIDDTVHYAGIQLHNCHYIKLTGSGDSSVRYGFHLKAVGAGVFLSGLSSDIELAFIAIDHYGFMGIQAKKDYHGNPPNPIPVFKNLVIHDCFIQHVSEGMYIGETKTPGMEFKHVRIFNNVVTQTQREAIQLANAVEDVEVYNNLMFDNGVAKLYAQSNNTQMGDNTVGDYYHNIISESNERGIVIFGMGHIRIYSNYIENNQGIFIDNRTVTDTLSSIVITGNYFLNTVGNQVVLNFNELNTVDLENNNFNTPITFYHSDCKDCTNATLQNNQEENLPKLQFSIVDGTYVPDAGNPQIYQDYGPQPGLGYKFNSWPAFVDLKNIYVNFGDSVHSTIKAIVTDNDSVAVNVTGLPSFVQKQQNGNGALLLRGLTQPSDKGIYRVIVSATEKSNGIDIKKAFNLVVRDPANKSPLIYANRNLVTKNLEKENFKVTVVDPDGDPVNLTADNLPSFVHLNRQNDSLFTLEVQPLYQDVGNYTFSLKADDGYGGVTQETFHLSVQQTPMDPGLIIYRENFGGPDLAGTPIDWQGVDASSTTYTSDKVYATGSYSWNGFNMTAAPDSLFGPFYYGATDKEKLHFHFKCEPGNYKVTLFFTDRQSDYDSNGPVIMNIWAQDSLIAKSLNISDGLINTAVEASFEVYVQDSLLSVTLEPVKNPVKICGAEISVAEPVNPDVYHAEWFAFPNPFSDSIRITNHHSDPIISWSLWETTGQLIMTEPVENSSFEPFIQLFFPNLKKGIYLIQIRTKKGIKSQKIIKL